MSILGLNKSFERNSRSERGLSYYETPLTPQRTTSQPNAHLDLRIRPPTYPMTRRTSTQTQLISSIPLPLLRPHQNPILPAQLRVPKRRFARFDPRLCFPHLRRGIQSAEQRCALQVTFLCFVRFEFGRVFEGAGLRVKFGVLDGFFVGEHSVAYFQDFVGGLRVQAVGSVDVEGVFRVGGFDGAAWLDTEAMCVAPLDDFVDCGDFALQLVVVAVGGSWVM